MTKTTLGGSVMGKPDDIQEAIMPPTHEPRRRKRMGQSVYVPAELAPVLAGYQSLPLTQAILCWAHLLETATPSLGAIFSAKEWACLAYCCAGRELSFDPLGEHPGSAIAECVGRGDRLGLTSVLREKGTSPIRLAEQVEELCRRLNDLTYLQGWAVIWALQYRSKFAIAPRSGEWWSLAHRQKTVPVPRLAGPG